MGGDLAPQEPIRGALRAIREMGVQVIFTGRKDDILATLQKDGYSNIPVGAEIVDCSEIIEVCDDPAVAWRKKQDSSMTVGLKLLKAGKGDAFLSAGSTGALLSGATLLVKRINGVKRAAVAPILPTSGGRAVLIDAGANSECTPELLEQFAIMGSHYAALALGCDRPRVGLLNIGSEPSKGTELYQHTWQRLDSLSKLGVIHFVGNIEGRDAIEGKADVIVADGFAGNIFLKTVEGTASCFYSELKAIFTKNARSMAAAALVKSEISAFKSKYDYHEIGGTALLGISRPVIKVHGSSDAYTFCSAIRQAVQYAEAGIAEQIEAQLAAAAQSTLHEKRN